MLNGESDLFSYILLQRRSKHEISVNLSDWKQPQSVKVSAVCFVVLLQDPLAEADLVKIPGFARDKIIDMLFKDFLQRAANYIIVVSTKGDIMVPLNRLRVEACNAASKIWWSGVVNKMLCVQETVEGATIDHFKQKLRPTKLNVCEALQRSSILNYRGILSFGFGHKNCDWGLNICPTVLGIFLVKCCMRSWSIRVTYFYFALLRILRDINKLVLR